MRSLFVTGATLVMCMMCAQAEAGFPQGSLGEPSVLGQRPSYPRPSSPQYQTPNYTAQRSVPPAGLPRPIDAGVPTPSAPVASATGLGCAPHVSPGPYGSGSMMTGPATGGAAYGPAPAYGSGTAYGSGMAYQSSPYFQSMAGPWSSAGAYASAASSGPTWFGGVYGILMARDGDETHHFVTDCTNMFLPSDSIESDYTGGVEARFGRTFNCARWGFEVLYWGIDPDDEQASVTAAQIGMPMLTTLNYGDIYLQHVDPATGLPYAFQTSAAVIGDNAVHTRVRRSEEFHNLELNFLSGPLSPANNFRGCDPCGVPYGNCRQSRWKAGWLFGVRYLKFDESLSLAMDDTDTVFDHVSPNAEFFHDIDIENDLVGVQLGLNFDYCLTKNLQLDLGSKFGLYGNHASQRQKICNSYGIATVNTVTPMPFDVNSDENDVAFLGELRAGLGYRVGCHMRVTAGYRVVAASGIATTVGQIKSGRVMGKLSEVADIDTDDSLVLHGAYTGLEFAW